MTDGSAAVLTTLLGMTGDELSAVAEAEGHRAYRGRQMAECLYRKGIHTLDQMVMLPQDFRARLSEQYVVGRSRLGAEQYSKDGTLKLLLELTDGARVETVGLPYADRTSCCVSTQVGCPIGCAFCATGLSGFTRNLTAGEIVDQVLTVQEALRLRIDQHGGDLIRIDHVTFMGMGEPLLNYDATTRAIWLLNNEMGIAMRHLTVSTVGFVPGIHRLATEGLQLNLAVSLHAADDTLRGRLVPGMRNWLVKQILDACRDYVRRTGRRVTIEYCLIDGINDLATQAAELAMVLRGLNCHVNLIPLNAVAGLHFRPATRERARAFRRVLDDAGIPVTQRLERGSDIHAACGQLRRRASEADRVTGDHAPKSLGSEGASGETSD